MDCNLLWIVNVCFNIKNVDTTRVQRAFYVKVGYQVQNVLKSFSVSTEDYRQHQGKQAQGDQIELI
jgi:hypothetical protein